MGGVLSASGVGFCKIYLTLVSMVCVIYKTCGSELARE
ncbi:hypothetical protein PSYMP_17136 [Pseudomonas amygdali pv. morsprunorum str. M302280]|nr:hypothetical protein PSYMP_17136 [Pseudomonas amygdali pv. morsprunorum str. M302280]